MRSLNCSSIRLLFQLIKWLETGVLDGNKKEGERRAKNV